MALKRTPNLFEYVVVILSMIFAVAVFVFVFERLPLESNSESRLGVDNILPALQNWDMFYTPDGRDGIKYPPWALLPLVPIGSLFSTRAAWGILVFITLTATVLSVPQQLRYKWRYRLAVLLAVASYPSLRNMADANLEGLVILGVTLIIWGYQKRSPLLLACGVLIGTVKVQSTALLMLVLAVYVLQTWEPRRWLKAVGFVLAVVIPTGLWHGGDWLRSIQNQYQSGTAIDMGLAAALNRIGGVPGWLIALAVLAVVLVTLGAAWFSKRDLPHEKVGILLAGSLLAAPYAAGNSLTVIVAFGMIPVFLSTPWLGLVLIALIDSLFFWPIEAVYNYSAYWGTGVLLITWVVLLWRLYRKEQVAKTQAEVPAVKAPAVQA